MFHTPYHCWASSTVIFVDLLESGSGQVVEFNVAQSKVVHLIVEFLNVVQLTPGTS